MKLSSILCTALFATLFIIGFRPSLEAKHHTSFSLNVGTFFPSYPPAYVATPYPPAYVERHVYVNPYGYPMTESIYVQPRPYYPVYPRPIVSGFSFGARFR